jgi:two-component system, chemotaxis family, protein-glutamate methylesterase/glutaminase
VVLTGMGSDGREGARSVREAGGHVLAQDQATSVVWGMPGAVAEAGLADMTLPIQDIGPEIARRLKGGA